MTLEPITMFEFQHVLEQNLNKHPTLRKYFVETKIVREAMEAGPAHTIDFMKQHVPALLPVLAFLSDHQQPLMEWGFRQSRLYKIYPDYFNDNVDTLCYEAIDSVITDYRRNGKPDCYTKSELVKKEIERINALPFGTQSA